MNCGIKNDVQRHLVDLVRACGKDIEEHAEDIVGAYGGINDLSITVNIPVYSGDVPTIDISREHVCKRAIHAIAQDT